MLCCSVTERTIGQKLFVSASLPRFTLSTGYYGLSLNSSQMHPNPFISSFLSAAVEVPAYISVWVALRFCRRKLCLLTILVFAAASLFFIQLVPEGMITFSSETISNKLWFIAYKKRVLLWRSGSFRGLMGADHLDFSRDFFLHPAPLIGFWGQNLLNFSQLTTKFVIFPIFSW